jgi:cytosine/creatinine deaminase
VTTILRNARLADGRLVDLTVDDERITAVHTAGPPGPGGARDGVVEHDLGSKLVLPALAEPHAHLDKAFTADRVPNPTGDLEGAIAAMGNIRGRWSRMDIEDRAERAARTLLAAGTTAVRTHVDVTPETGTRHAEALVAVRERLRGLVDIQVVALMGRPTGGPEGRDQRARLRDALDLGADGVGGAPYLDPDPRAAYEGLVEIAGERGALVDLHTDETLDAGCLTLLDFAEVVRTSGFRGLAAASHCVSLGMADAATQARVAEAVAAVGMSVVTLPQTNLFLQARGVATAPARGLTAIAALRAAGVTVAGGADNIQDPFNLVGRGDQLETAALLVMAGHLRPELAFELVSNAARRALGHDEVTLAPGSPAELVAVDAANVREAVAAAPATRTVVHRGRVVAESAVSTIMAEASGTGQATGINRSLMVRPAKTTHS